jgi:hypothetical protein
MNHTNHTNHTKRLSDDLGMYEDKDKAAERICLGIYLSSAVIVLGCLAWAFNL